MVILEKQKMSSKEAKQVIFFIYNIEILMKKTKQNIKLYACTLVQF